MAKQVDLNADLGESFGVYTLGLDAEVLPYLSSANVACGWHAGDPMVMTRTVALARDCGVAIGAHPGFPDLMGFGRRAMKVSPEEARAYVVYQLGALSAFARAAGTRLHHVKPHGALYNMAAADGALAEAICLGVRDVDPALILLGLSGSKLVSAAEAVGLRAAGEVFADRAYLPDGSLAPRGTAGAVLHDEDEAIRRVLRMVREGRVTSVGGTDVVLRADSICVHGDNPRAVAFVRAIRGALDAEGIRVRPLAEIV